MVRHGTRTLGPRQHRWSHFHWGQARPHHVLPFKSPCGWKKKKEHQYTWLQPQYPPMGTQEHPEVPVSTQQHSAVPTPTVTLPAGGCDFLCGCSLLDLGSCVGCWAELRSTSALCPGTRVPAPREPSVPEPVTLPTPLSSCCLHPVCLWLCLCSLCSPCAAAAENWSPGERGQRSQGES